MQQKVTEAMTLPLPEDKNGILCAQATEKIVSFAAGYDTVVFGPGIGGVRLL